MRPDAWILTILHRLTIPVILENTVRLQSWFFCTLFWIPVTVTYDMQHLNSLMTWIRTCRSSRIYSELLFVSVVSIWSASHSFYFGLLSFTYRHTLPSVCHSFTHLFLFMVTNWRTILLILLGLHQHTLCQIFAQKLRTWNDVTPTVLYSS